MKTKELWVAETENMIQLFIDDKLTENDLREFLRLRCYDQDEIDGMIEAAHD